MSIFLVLNLVERVYRLEIGKSTVKKSRSLSLSLSSRVIIFAQCNHPTLVLKYQVKMKKKKKKKLIRGRKWEHKLFLERNTHTYTQEDYIISLLFVIVLK